METQVYFGNYNLQNSLSTVSVGEWRNTPSELVQTLPIARGRGISVVNTKTDAKRIQISGVLKVDGVSVNSLEALTKKIDRVFSSNRSKYLRSVPNYIELIPTNTATGWTGSSDTANVAVDTTNFQTGSSSLGFDIDVSVSGDNKAVLTYSGTAVDLSSHSDTGNFEFTLNIPDAYYITSVDFRIGNDSSNYYSTSLTSNYEGNQIENGYNLFSVDWATISQTGTVNDAVIDYCVITINYDSGAVDINDCFIDSIQWVDEDRVRNYPVYLEGEIQREGRHYNISFTKWTANFLNYKGYAIGTHNNSIFSSTVTGLTETQKFTLDSSIETSPEFRFVVNTNTALGSIGLTNLENNSTIELLPSAIANGDTFIVGGTSNKVEQNGQAINFTGRIPSFNIIGSKRVSLNLEASSPTIKSYTTYNTDLYASSTYPYKAVSFVANATGTITSVTIKARQTEVYSAGGGHRVAIYSDSAGSPSTAIGTPGYINTASTSLVDLTTSLNASVTNGTTYWIVILVYKGTSPNASNLSWAGDTGLGDAGGTSKRANTSLTWSALSTNADLYYSVTIQATPAWSVTWSSNYKKLYAD